MHKSATKCNETVGKWCKNKHGGLKIIDTLETYQPSLVSIGQMTRRPPRHGMAWGCTGPASTGASWPLLDFAHQTWLKRGAPPISFDLIVLSTLISLSFSLISWLSDAGVLADWLCVDEHIREGFDGPQSKDSAIRLPNKIIPISPRLELFYMSFETWASVCWDLSL
jgi:hypothetical protein